MSKIIWRIEEFPEIDSTNTWLKEKARLGEPAGLVARADYQSAGRGRLDRTWEAPTRSGLLASLLVRPSVTIEDFYLVSVVVALSARTALVRLCGLQPSLKWPNDLIVGDAKLGGILGEGVVDEQGGRAAVVGIGLNLTWPGPPGVGGTCVRDVAGVTIEPRAMLDALLDEVDPRLVQLEHGRDLLIAEFTDALSTLGRVVRVEAATGTREGVAESIDEHGRLCVRTDDGLHPYAAGDVVHLRPAP
jgi:BirA family transcriptional regulator, biotin operon repressor / biotin---[acetyl-CoA-carboxylase] ligase